MKYCWACMSEMDDGPICPHCGYDNDTMVELSFCLKAGSVIGNHFVIGRVLGYGGFGITYIARDTLLSRVIAIKEYFPTSCVTRIPGESAITLISENIQREYQTGLESFVDEARRLSSFEDIEGIVRVFDCIRENNTAYLVMELLEGETVKEFRRRKGELKSSEAIDIICSVLASLHKVHQSGIIHRDVSPDNIFLTKDQKVKLIDFGAARQVSPNATKSLSVILKPGFAPVEQYQAHGKQGPWTDVYGAGATLYWMLTGIKPSNSLDRLRKDDLALPIDLGVDITEHHQAVLKKSLSVKPEDRFQSAEEFREELSGSNNTPEELKLKSLRAEGWNAEKEQSFNKTPHSTKRFLPALLMALVVCVLAVMITGHLGNGQFFGTDSETLSEITSKPSNVSTSTAGIPQVEDYEIDWIDENLEKAIRNAIEIEDRAILYSDVKDITELDLSNNSIHDISALINMPNLKSLDLSWNYIKDISALIDLPELTTLDLTNNHLSDISELARLNHLTNLTMAVSNISDISWITNLNNLTALDLNSNQISDISPLSSLDNLAQLELDYNKISDISPLSSLDNLAQLALDYNEIGDISALSYLGNMTKLTLNHNNISDVEVLANLKSLTFLCSSWNNISDIGALENLRNLKYLDLSYNSVRDVRPLSSLNNLTDLCLCWNTLYLNNIDILANLTNLTYLNLKGNTIKDVNVLKGLYKLSILDLSDTLISDISVLSNLGNLTKLNLSNTGITDISALCEMNKLEILYLSETDIFDISPLSHLQNLKELKLGLTNVSDISVLSNLINLEELELWATNISDISVLSNLRKLIKLNLSDNSLIDISVLSTLNNLTSLDLRNNEISDISALKNLTDLEELYLSGNPVDDLSPLDGKYIIENDFWF